MAQAGRAGDKVWEAGATGWGGHPGRGGEWRDPLALTSHHLVTGAEGRGRWQGWGWGWTRRFQHLGHKVHNLSLTTRTRHLAERVALTPLRPFCRGRNLRPTEARCLA